MTHFFAPFAFYLHILHLLSSYKCLLLIQQILSWFVPPNASFNNPITFLFFPLGNGLPNPWFEVSNQIQHFLQYIYKYHLFLCMQWNCVYPYNIILLFYHILVLHNQTKNHTLINPNIESPKQTLLFISIRVCFIFIANKFSVKKFVVWQFGSDTK